MDITMQKAIQQIDSSGGRPFVIHFAKKDGSIRQMVAVKRNRLKNTNGTAVKKSNFNFMLHDKNVLLVNEVASFTTTQKTIPGVGTVHELKEKPNFMTLDVAKMRQVPRNIVIHQIKSLNGNTVWA